VREPRRPIARQPDRASLRHLDKRERLPRFRNQAIVSWSSNVKGAAKTCPSEVFELPENQQLIAEAGGLFVIDLNSDDDREKAGAGQRGKVHAELFRKQRAPDLDKSQVGEIVHDCRAISVKEHYLHFGLDRRRQRRVHRGDMSKGRRFESSAKKISRRMGPQAFGLSLRRRLEYGSSVLRGSISMLLL
jgi:hypothetical protein